MGLTTGDSNFVSTYDKALFWQLTLQMLEYDAAPKNQSLMLYPRPTPESAAA